MTKEEANRQSATDLQNLIVDVFSKDYSSCYRSKNINLRNMKHFIIYLLKQLSYNCMRIMTFSKYLDKFQAITYSLIGIRKCQICFYKYYKSYFYKSFFLSTLLFIIQFNFNKSIALKYSNK